MVLFCRQRQTWSLYYLDCTLIRISVYNIVSPSWLEWLVTNPQRYSWFHRCSRLVAVQGHHTIQLALKLERKSYYHPTRQWKVNNLCRLRCTLKVFHRSIGLHKCNWILNYSFLEPIEGGYEVADRHREVSYHIDFVVVDKLGTRSKETPLVEW